MAIAEFVLVVSVRTIYSSVLYSHTLHDILELNWLGGDGWVEERPIRACIFPVKADFLAL